jgi:hypothetical protein
MIKTFESFGQREIILTNKRNSSIVIKLNVVNSRIVSIKHLRKIGTEEIETEPVVRFPFSEGQTLSRNMEVWACNNNFYMDGKDTCPEKKIFGVRTSDVPQGHEWRHIYPGKFR